MSQEILRVQNLKVHFDSIMGIYKVVDGVDISVNHNEIFGIAGESGCGKSTLVEGILKLIVPPGYIKSGQIHFDGIDILNTDSESMRKLRSKRLAYVPQGSMNSLNPVTRVKDQISETIRTHDSVSKKEASKKVVELLSAVNLPPETGDMFPHELSGGMKQRVCIAIAMSLGPDLIVADEPTTALDVTVQRVVLQSIKEMKERLNATVIMISHDMGVHAELADRVAVMYAGQVCEVADVNTIFEEPLHPYVQEFVKCIPSLDAKELKGIDGLAPSPLNWPSGCRFHTRCPYVMDKCKTEVPTTIEVKPGHTVACHLVE